MTVARLETLYCDADCPWIFLKRRTGEGIVRWAEITAHGSPHGLAGIENALLDIKAMALGIPVYELFGEPIRETTIELPPYGSGA